MVIVILLDLFIPVIELLVTGYCYFTDLFILVIELLVTGYC